MTNSPPIVDPHRYMEFDLAAPTAIVAKPSPSGVAQSPTHQRNSLIFAKIIWPAPPVYTPKEVLVITQVQKSRYKLTLQIYLPGQQVSSALKVLEPTKSIYLPV